MEDLTLLNILAENNPAELNERNEGDNTLVHLVQAALDRNVLLGLEQVWWSSIMHKKLRN